MKLFATMTVSLCLTPIALPQGGSGGGTQNPFDGLDDALAKVRLTCRTKTIRMTDGEADQLAGQLMQMSGTSLNFDPERSDQDRRVYTDPQDRSAILDINLRSRGFLFNGGMDRYRDDGDTPGLPNRKAARLLAMDHLKNLNLRPKKGTFEIAHVGGLNMAIHRETGETDEYRKLVSVRLDRIQDGFDVIGPGSRILVHLGEHGRLQGLIWEWERFRGRPLDEAEKMTGLEIRRLAQLRLGLVGSMAVDKRIREVEVVYFDDGFGVKEPAVHIIARLTFHSPDSETGEIIKFTNPYDFYIPIPLVAQGYYPFHEDQGTPPPADD